MLRKECPRDVRELDTVDVPSSSADPPFAIAVLQTPFAFIALIPLAGPCVDPFTAPIRLAGPCADPFTTPIHTVPDFLTTPVLLAITFRIAVALVAVALVAACQINSSEFFLVIPSLRGHAEGTCCPL